MSEHATAAGRADAGDDTPGARSHPGDGDRNRLGRAAAARFQRPGGRRGRQGVLGSVAVAARRFAVGVARPVEIRRQLAGPGEIRPRPFDPVSRPPRWWVPGPDPAVAADRAWNRDAAEIPPSLPPRGLPRAARSVPTETNHAPGGFTSLMRGAPIRVRRIKEVTEVGSLPGAGKKLTPPARRGDPGTSPPARSPGPAAGDGGAHRPTAGAVPRSARHGPHVRPPDRGALLRRAWSGRAAEAGTPAAGPARPGPVGTGVRPDAPSSGPVTGPIRRLPAPGSGPRAGAPAPATGPAAAAPPGPDLPGHASGTPDSAPAQVHTSVDVAQDVAPADAAQVHASADVAQAVATARSGAIDASAGSAAIDASAGSFPVRGAGTAASPGAAAHPAAEGPTGGQSGDGGASLASRAGHESAGVRTDSPAVRRWARTARSPRMPAELGARLIRRRVRPAAGADPGAPLRRAVDQLPGPGAQPLASLTTAAPIRARRFGDVPRPPLGYRPLVEGVEPQRYSPRSGPAEGWAGGPTPAGSPFGTSGTPAAADGAAAIPSPARPGDIPDTVRRSAIPDAAPGGPPRTPPATGAPASATGAAVQATGSVNPAGAVPATGSANPAGAVPATGSASPGGPAQATGTADTTRATGPDGAAGAAVTTPSTADGAVSGQPGRHRGPDPAPSKEFSPGGPSAPGSRARPAAPGGLLRRLVAAVTGSGAAAGDASGATRTAASPAATGTARRASERGPVLLRSMSTAGPVAATPSEIAPASTRLLAGASVAPRGVWLPAPAQVHPAGSGPATDGSRRSGAAPAAVTPAGSPTAHRQPPAPTAPSAVTAPRAATAPPSVDGPRAANRPATSPAVRRTTAPRSVPERPATSVAPSRATTAAARFVSAAGLPGVLRRIPAGVGSGSGAGTMVHGHSGGFLHGQTGAFLTAAPPLGPGAIGALISGPPPVPAGGRPTSGDRLAGAGRPAVAGGRAFGSIRRAAAGVDRITPSATATARSVPPRLAVLPLPLRTAGPAPSAGTTRTAGTTGTGRPAVRRSLASLASAPPTAPTAPTAPAAPAASAMSAVRPVGVPVPGRQSADAAFAPRHAGPVAPGSAGRPASPGTVGAAGRIRRTAIGAGAAAPPDEIRPATLELLRTARVAPPRGLPAPAEAPAAPPVPASALAGSPQAVLRRNPSAATGAAARAAGTVPASTGVGPATGASADSLIGRVPASLFERARAELRAAAAGSPGIADAGASGQVIRRSPPGSEIAIRSGSAVAAAPGSTPAGGAAGSASVQASLTSREWDELVDEVVRRIEDRVSDELARRGRRFIPRTM